MKIFSLDAHPPLIMISTWTGRSISFLQCFFYLWFYESYKEARLCNALFRLLVNFISNNLIKFQIFVNDSKWVSILI